MELALNLHQKDVKADVSRGEMRGYSIGKNIVVTRVKINTYSPFGHLT